MSRCYGSSDTSYYGVDSMTAISNYTPKVRQPATILQPYREYSPIFEPRVPRTPRKVREELPDYPESGPEGFENPDQAQFLMFVIAVMIMAILISNIVTIREQSRMINLLLAQLRSPTNAPGPSPV